MDYCVLFVLEVFKSFIDILGTRVIFFWGLIKKGQNERATSCTKLNAISSRSHAMFIVIVEQNKIEMDLPGTSTSSKGSNIFILWIKTEINLISIYLMNVEEMTNISKQNLTKVSNSIFKKNVTYSRKIFWGIFDFSKNFAKSLGIFTNRFQSNKLKRSPNTRTSTLPGKNYRFHTPTPGNKLQLLKFLNYRIFFFIDRI